jgi:hypothetical protein
MQCTQSLPAFPVPDTGKPDPGFVEVRTSEERKSKCSSAIGLNRPICIHVFSIAMYSMIYIAVYRTVFDK